MLIINKRNWAVFGCCLGLLFCLVIFLYLYNPIIKIELSGNQVPGQIVLSQSEQKMLIRELTRAEFIGRGVCQAPRLTLSVRKKKGMDRYLIDKDNLIYDSTGQIVQPGKKLQELLTALEQKLRDRSLYGEMIAWSEADKIFPRFARAQVQDFDSRLAFWVQRRAGRAHADVQPLTAEDTAIMKQIYGGKWSWKRRAILVKIKGRKLAASMNGMPHGAGSISGNNFPGHFCIHFYNSKTHSGRVNLEHQIMVWKAAGKFGEMTRRAVPRRIMEVFFTAVDQGEVNLAEQLMAIKDKKEKRDLNEILHRIEWLTVSGCKATQESPGQSVFLVKLEVGLEKEPGKLEREGYLLLCRSKGAAPWKIDGSSLLKLLKSQEKVQWPGGIKSQG